MECVFIPDSRNPALLTSIAIADSWLHVNDKMEGHDKFAFSLRQAITVPISVAWIDFISVVPMQYIPQLKSSPKNWKKMKSGMWRDSVIIAERC